MITVVPNPVVPDSPTVTHLGRARWHGTGRRGFTARVVVWHTSEPKDPDKTTIANALSYDARRDDQVSATYFAGTDGIGQEVAEDDRPYTQTRYNDEGISIEIVATAVWSEAQWRARPALLDNVVNLTADICRRRGIPARWLTAQELLAGEWGIVDHLTCNQAAILEDPSRKGRTGYTHTDCGAGFRAVAPELVARVAALLAPPIVQPPEIVTPPQEDDDMRFIQVPGDLAVYKVSGVHACWVRNGNAVQHELVRAEGGQVHQVALDDLAAYVFVGDSPAGITGVTTSPANFAGWLQ